MTSLREPFIGGGNNRTSFDVEKITTNTTAGHQDEEVFGERKGGENVVARDRIRISKLKLFIKSFVLIILGVIIGIIIPFPFGINHNKNTNRIMVPVKNVIYIIADGMSPATTSAYRYYRDTSKNMEELVPPTIFDGLLVGMQRPYSLNRGVDLGKDKFTYITDSASSATALNTGHKTLNNYVSMDPNVKPIEPTLMEYAKRNLGKTTGSIVTSDLTDATPAAFYAHQQYRKSKDEIANQFFDNQYKNKPIADLLLGGGTKYFKRNDRNVAKELQDKAGFTVVETFTAFEENGKQLPLLGLFAEKNMPWSIDLPNNDSDIPQNKLTKMVQTGLRLLENDENAKKNGFVLLVESSQIDKCEHQNDIACTMAEMDDLHSTMEIVLDFIKNKDPDTLMVLTADHATGGLSIGKQVDRTAGLATGADYVWKPELIRKIKGNVGTVTSHFFSLTTPLEEQKYLKEIIGLPPSADLEKLLADLQEWKKKVTSSPLSYEDVCVGQQILADYINDKTNTGWTTYGHVGDDVQIYAAGKHQGIFNMNMENTGIAERIFKLLGKV